MTIRRPLTFAAVSLLLGCAIIVVAACSPVQPTTTVTATTLPTTATTTATATLPTPQPVDLVSAAGPLPPINPGGPIIELTLKNVSTVPVVALSARLDAGRSFDFVFDVTSAKPLMTGQTISSRMTLIGGGMSSNVPSPVTISGTLQNGATFTYIQKAYFAGSTTTTSAQ